MDTDAVFRAMADLSMLSHGFGWWHIETVGGWPFVNCSGSWSGDHERGKPRFVRKRRWRWEVKAGGEGGR
jgi:hypothetical protein